MKIGVIIPDRNDRPLFLKNCMRMLAAQTLLPEIIEVVNYPPESEKVDITQRYRRGYDALRNKGLDFIALIENDDYYCPEYLETMSKFWIREGKPRLMGLDHTVYYNINIFAHFTMTHSQRSSAMNTIIIPDMDFDWGPDENPYADAWLWHYLKGQIVVIEKEICIGIKHGIGKCGGQTHTTHLSRMKEKDPDKTFLKSVTDPVSFEFYANYFKNNS